MLLRHQGQQQSIPVTASHITSLLADIREIADCQEQMTTDVRMAMEEIDTKNPGITDGVCTSLEEELNDYFRSGKRKEQQMLEEEDAEQRRSSPDYGGKFLNGPVSTTRAGVITGNEILPRTAPK